jgi:gliding motility-associated transport system ATP-binding protein
MTSLIEIDGLEKRYGPLTAVAGLTFSVAKGEVLGFLGPNGAGKSTSMKMITGYLEPSAGRVRICGLDMALQPLAAQARLGYLPEGAPAYADMTPRQLLLFVARVRGLKGEAFEAAFARTVARTDLKAVLDQPIDTLSKGFKRRVGLAQAILHDPPVLVMDEPTDGLDPNQKHSVRMLITRMAADKAIVISTHILEEVEAVCTRALIIDRGRIVADGTPAALAARSRYHNAVTLTLAAQEAATIRAGLSSLAGVGGIEERETDAGEIALTLLPREGGLIIEEVSQLALAQGWALKGLYAEPGRLDEVFRRLTTPDARHDTAPAEDAA